MRPAGILLALSALWIPPPAVPLAAPLAAPPRGAPDVRALQPGLQAHTVRLADGSTARLEDLAPAVGAWYLLTLKAGTPGQTTWHLENAAPGRARLALEEAAGGRLVLHADDAGACVVPLEPADRLLQARRSGLPFAPLCDGRLYVRNQLAGHRTPLEATTQFLRDHVWGGEQIVGFVRREFYQDAFALRSASGAAAPAAATRPGDLPAPARLGPAAGPAGLVPTDLGLDVGPVERLEPGRWMPVRGAPGVAVTALTPAQVQGSPALAHAPAWSPDPVEAAALDYLVAFDLDRFDVGFALGTDHPRLGWSARATDAMRDERLPGPDGIDSAAPLERTGELIPSAAARVAATFTGGFKREHGAFRYGALAGVNHASHYGFVEQGVVFSTLQPGLSTLFVTTAGRVDIRTWRAEDRSLLGDLRFARQNGVALVEDAAGGEPRPGPLVDRWGAGNWSGSADERLRTLRAGACIIESGARRWLVYGWFSTATPATLARVFLAAGCRRAMHLDMNALEHTYLALYVHAAGKLHVEHLVEGMSVLDEQAGPSVVPRFVGFPDDRDFFYVLRKETAP